MFERQKEKKVAEAYQRQVAQWQTAHDATAELLRTAQHFAGEPSPQMTLKAGEAAFATVAGAALIESRRGQGHWEGRSSGLSVPVGSLGGHAVRYHVGASRGHYVQASPVPTAVDTGTVVVTDQRVIFHGARQTRECLFAKLLGYQHQADGSTVLSVSNRQKPTVIHYGGALAGWFDFRLELALARHRGTVPALVEELRRQQAALDRSRPVAPSPAP